MARTLNIEKAQKGTTEYDEWLRKYHEKRRKKAEQEAEKERTRLAKEAKEAFDKQTRSIVLSKLKGFNNTSELLIGDEVISWNGQDSITPELVEHIANQYGRKVQIFDNIKFKEAKPVKVTDKDWERMVDLNFSSKSAEVVAKTIKDKDKAIARYIAELKLSGSSVPDNFDVFSNPFALQAIKLGATREDFQVSFNATGSCPAKFEQKAQKMRDHKYSNRFIGSMSRKLDQAGVNYHISGGGNAVTQEGRDAMSRSGARWSIGYTYEILDKDNNKVGSVSFDAITHEGDGQTFYSMGYGHCSQQDIINRVIEIAKSAGTLEKAKKGTAAYDEWLHKYREKKVAKKDVQSKENKQQVKDAFLNKTAISNLRDSIENTLEVYNEDLRENDWHQWYNNVKQYIQNVQNAITSATGINFKKNFKGNIIATLGEYDSRDSGTRTTVELYYDTGISTFVDHSWSQSAKRTRKGGLILRVRYPGEGGSGRSINLSDASEEEIKNVCTSLKEIDKIKKTDIIGIKGTSSQLKTGSLVKEILNKNLNKALSEDDLIKAKKGTPEYAEWLRKYREKRGLKPEEPKGPGRQAKSILDDLKNHKPEQLSLFENSSSGEKEDKTADEQINATPAIPLVSEQDSRAIMQMEKSVADVRVTPELLVASQQPVFANLFGHYPVHALKYQNRLVITPVEEIDVALAEEPDEVTQEMLDDPNLIATEKVDGVRCTIICTPEATRLTARRQQYSEKPPTDYTNNLPHIRDIDLYSVLGDTVIDSEAAATNPIETAPGKYGDSLSSTMSVIGQEKDLNVCIEKMEKYGPLVTFAFDIQRYKGQDLRALPYTERMKYLDQAMSEIKAAFGTEYFKRVTSQRPEETKKQFFERITTGGGEGCVLAKADGPYKAFDRKNRIKYKRRVELTLQVMDVLEGKGRNAGTAGSFIMGAVINGVLTPIANLNTGDDSLRKEAWINKDAFIGKQIEVTAMQMTLGTGKDGQPRLRHPRWKTSGILREDKLIPDDISKTIAVLKRRRDGAID